MAKAKASWLEALAGQKLEVRSASDALTVKGWLDTGNYGLNYAITGRFLRGYPLGHTVEIFGDQSSGKSYLLACAMARAQAQGGVVLLDDTEGAYNLEWLRALGVDVNELGIPNPPSRTVAEHLRATKAFIGAYQQMQRRKAFDGPGLICCDSLAQLSTTHELETMLDKKDMSKAAELKAFFRIVGPELNALPVVHLSANHTIANIGNPFNKRTTPGGGGPRFSASVRLDLRSPSKLKIEEEYVGVLCRAVVDKNRLAPPWKEVRLAIPFHQPISRASGLIPILTRLGILEVYGQFLKYNGKKVGRAYNDDKKHVLKQDEMAEQLLDQVPELLVEADDRLAKGLLATPTPTGTGLPPDAVEEELEEDQTSTEA